MTAEKLCNPAYLHLLILDEFDWGVSKGSQLNEYLQRVVAVRQKQLKKNQECRLLFLPISATPEMLLAPDDEYNNYKVSLLDLAASPTDSIFFATPVSYLSLLATSMLLPLNSTITSDVPIHLRARLRTSCTTL
jgi:hypothetical protein